MDYPCLCILYHQLLVLCKTHTALQCLSSSVQVDVAGMLGALKIELM